MRRGEKGRINQRLGEERKTKTEGERNGKIEGGRGR